MVDREVDGQHDFSLIFVRRRFRWMVDREVDGPVWEVLGRSWGLCVRSWAALGAYVGGPGSLSGPMFAVLAALGPSVGGLGRSGAEK